MSLLRLRISLAEPPLRCRWSLLEGGREPGYEPMTGEGPLTDLPHRSGPVQLVIPAAQVLITRIRLPRVGRRLSGSVLAYAVEDEIVGDADSGQVSWLGTAGDDDVLAVVDKPALQRWLDALDGVGIRNPVVGCEALLVPWTEGEWSLAWDGHEGIVRTGQLEGAATDCGNRESPPLSLRLLLDDAQTRGTRPDSIALHVSAKAAAPDVASWQRQLGVRLRPAGAWDWQSAPVSSIGALTPPRRGWRLAPGVLARLRPAAWIAGIALAIQAVAMVADWASLAGKQRALREEMVTLFRTTFPDAVAVVDPALQMHRKLVEARHAAGHADAGDFLPMLGLVAAATSDLPAGAVRKLSYDGGRMMVELVAIDPTLVPRVVARLGESGLIAEPAVDASPSSPSSPSTARTTVLLSVRAS